MDNLFVGNQKREFVVWVDPNDPIANWNLNKIGTFFSTPPSESGDYLVFIPNLKFTGFISPFQNNMLRSYSAEYNLELSRRSYFSDYPSRLGAVFLFENEVEARGYRERNPWHVGEREMKRVVSVGDYRLSRHDCTWVDFMRLLSMMDPGTIHNVCEAYWRGDTVKSCELTLYGKPWSKEPICSRSRSLTVTSLISVSAYAA